MQINQQIGIGNIECLGKCVCALLCLYVTTVYSTAIIIQLLSKEIGIMRWDYWTITHHQHIKQTQRRQQQQHSLNYSHWFAIVINYVGLVFALCIWRILPSVLKYWKDRMNSMPLIYYMDVVFVCVFFFGSILLRSNGWRSMKTSYFE